MRPLRRTGEARRRSLVKHLLSLVAESSFIGLHLVDTSPIMSALKRVCRPRSGSCQGRLPHWRLGQVSCAGGTYGIGDGGCSVLECRISGRMWAQSGSIRPNATVLSSSWRCAACPTMGGELMSEIRHHPVGMASDVAIAIETAFGPSITDVSIGDRGALIETLCFVRLGFEARHRDTKSRATFDCQGE